MDAATTVTAPLVAGSRDLVVLRRHLPHLPARIEDHVSSLIEAAALLAASGTGLVLVPVWAPVYLAWCRSEDRDPGSADGLSAFVHRPAGLDVRHPAVDGVSILEALAVETDRSTALAHALSRPDVADEAGAVRLWTEAGLFLGDLGANA